MQDDLNEQRGRSEESQPLRQGQLSSGGVNGSSTAYAMEVEVPLQDDRTKFRYHTINSNEF